MRRRENENCVVKRLEQRQIEKKYSLAFTPFVHPKGPKGALISNSFGKFANLKSHVLSFVSIECAILSIYRII